MFGECHAHLIMDGLNYKEAISIHKDHVNDEVIRKHLKAYEELGIVFVRGWWRCIRSIGKSLGDMAPEYGIDYRTPVFAIHKNGHYGSIVGKGF